MSGMSDAELIEHLKANLHRAGYGRARLANIVPKSELPTHWRIIEGLDWQARADLRQAAAAPRGRIRRRPTTLRGVDTLNRRELIIVVNRTPHYITYEITDEGRKMLRALPDAEADDPHSRANARAARRLKRALRWAQREMEEAHQTDE